MAPRAVSASQLPSAQWLDLPHCVLPAGEGAEELVLGQCPRSARLIAPKDMQSTLWIHKPGGGRGTEPPALLLGCLPAQAFAVE